jgi:hypothetical protein
LSNPAIISDRKLREQVISLVQSVRSGIPQNTSVHAIAGHFGLEVKEGTLSNDKDGAYIENEAKIIINSIVTSEERKLFTLYHELVHYLIRQDDDLYSYLHETYPSSNDFDKTIELICNIGAAEFILPQEIVRDYIDKEGFSLNLIPAICHQGCISGPAALIQLIQCAPHRCYGVVCNYGVPPNYGNANQNAFIPAEKANTLYVLYAIWSSSAKYTISRFTPIPNDHILFKALSDSNLIFGKDRIPFRSGTNWPVPCEVLYFRSSVYGLFNVKPPPSNQQPRLF